ncbi:PREDICTED: organic cation transporter protein-like [Branchiostoma belcheri]|uniref:Organic cation transporter protein-like n=1 Tax=Branchiostoma belcheri TaxID=7741 RepID=A0A6P5A1K1_BRABE|nr:PREDICTED: organic cation transporter protein-like [Branchiostoma belcheri]
MNYDAVLQHIGEFGAYQRRITVLLSLIAIPAGLHTGAMTFIAAIPEHHCRVPQTTSAGVNLTRPEALNLSVPMEVVEGTRRLSRCRRYDRPDQAGWLNRTTSTCTGGWEYDQSQYRSSIVTQYDLVCGRAWLRELAQSIFMAGVGLGGIIFGVISDRVGRHVTLMTCLLLQLTFGVCAAFSPSLTTFAVLRFLVGAFCNGAYCAGLVMGMESLGPSKRTAFGMLMCQMPAVGYLVLGLMAYFIRDWWLLQLALSLPTLPLLMYWWFVSESPRWLIVAKKTDRARLVIERIAKENGVNFSQETFQKLNGCAEGQNDDGRTPPSSKSRKYSIVDLVRTPQMRKITLAMNLAWLIAVCVYYSLVLGTSQLIGDHYVNFVLGACVEMVAICVAWLLMARFGGKRPFIGFMLVAGASCLALAGVPHDSGIVTTTLAMVGRFGISIGFGTLMVFSAEVFPTVIRNMGVGQASMVSRLGGIVAPFVGLLGNAWRPLPFLVYGVLCCLAGVAVTVIPETLGISLPNTPEDLERLVRSQLTTAAPEFPDEAERSRAVPGVANSSATTTVYQMVSSV